ncbi:MAG: M67 family metallopeptidase [Candidatus Bathyarchaeia archaeon]
MVVYITAGQLQLIVNHARAAYPEECCGFLVGTDSDGRRIHRALSAQNTSRSSRKKRFNIDPMELIRADEEARRSNLDLVGVYHSHPDAPAQPSKVDLDNAWPGYTYLVVSVQNGEPKDFAAWLLSEDRSAFHLDDMRVLAD